MANGTRTYGCILRWALGATLIAMAGLAACGDGAGSHDGANSGGGGGGEAASGHLWHNFFPLGDGTGLYVSSPDGARTRHIDEAKDAVPTPDGSHYVTLEHDLSADTSQVSIKSNSDGRVVHQAVLNGYVSKVRPSPLRLGDLLLVWASSAIAGDGVVTAIDLPARRTLQRWPTRAAADWLPDGRVISAEPTGAVHVAIVGQQDSAVGTLSVPGWTLRGLWSDPTGSRIVTRWMRFNASGDPAETDLWIAGADGTGLQRLTRTGLTSYAVWAPDDRSFAFDWDPANVCTGTACVGAGGCELHTAPATAREVTLDHASVRPIAVTDDEGQAATLGCDLLGWTR
ncbi:six-bladed beta-propeller, TolB-like protein [Rubrivivax benzoatilyticus]|uniref:Six-bladed beta-propeller, TolB-like protein n=1 Tax=Rubrivivax benzoatilyticus TaxID=316997 RepID=A0ABX0HTW3_9BURK|nr:six-bladed beta-propeller, TolB-like protein [Rubrivivax benzoatilyticus]NHK96795.1 six-bladed beta-propeller, TolB-like protein [Rubrivivax benzoatilyticus]NHL24510.1 six-bladed beta-propeller, TolB-like protein [Rubrivivax benzoatilyticus]